MRRATRPTGRRAGGAVLSRKQAEVLKMSHSGKRTMFEKIWDAHVVHAADGQQTILYIDRHLVHEVTSAQAFEGLRLAGRRVRRPELTTATPDHNVPTTDRSKPIEDPEKLKQLLRDGSGGDDAWGEGTSMDLVNGILYVKAPWKQQNKVRTLLNQFRQFK